MVDYSDRGIVWYAMLTTYRRELKAKAFLDERGIESFIPMQSSVARVRGVKRVVAKPAIHNLIFVKTDISELCTIKQQLNFLHNRLTLEEGQLSPIIVPTEQMDMFIKAMTNTIDKVAIVDLSTSTLEKGAKVRITDGEFKGYRGVLNKVKGKRDRRVAINIEGVIAYTIDVEANFIEKI